MGAVMRLHLLTLSTQQSLASQGKMVARLRICTRAFEAWNRMKLRVGRNHVRLPIHQGSSTKRGFAPWRLIHFLADGCLAVATRQAGLG